MQPVIDWEALSKAVQSGRITCQTVLLSDKLAALQLIERTESGDPLKSMDILADIVKRP